MIAIVNPKNMELEYRKKLIKMDSNEFFKKVEATPEVEPDKWDAELLAAIDNETDNSTATLNDVELRRQFNGKISLRLPKSLHRELVQKSKDEGISLNQFILYKLAK